MGLLTVTLGTGGGASDGAPPQPRKKPAKKSPSKALKQRNLDIIQGSYETFTVKQ
jgi:hypothetical protein